MIKKIFKFISLTLIFCMFMPIAVLGEESATIRNITYEEWVAEQNGIDSSYEAVQSDMEPVNISVDRQEQNDFCVQTIYREGISGNKSLDSILKGKGKYELDGEVNLATKEESVVSTIKENVEPINDESLANNTISGNIVESEDNGSRMNDSGLTRTAPTAGLIPIIINEDSLVNGQLTTETIIAFLYDDVDSDGDTIVGRYVDGSAVDFILGEIDGGFVMQITEPGTYLLIYQVEDSAGEFSRMLRFSFDVIEAPVNDDYQVFEGSFSSENDTATYNFSIDFTEMRSAAVCLVRKGYVGTWLEVFDESGNQVLKEITANRKAKDWGYIDKPSADATVCNYTVVVKPYSYQDRASDYRIIIGDKKDTELMMSGIENTVLLEQYYHADTNLENSAYVPNVGEYWYKYKRGSTSVITILNNVTDLRFQILDPDSLGVMFDSAEHSQTHRDIVGSVSWVSAEKARLTTVVGREYYLVVYSTNPNPDLPLRAGNMSTAVGNPIMTGGSKTVTLERAVSLPNTGYSSTVSIDLNGNDVPQTAQVKTINFGGTHLSYVERWRMKAPNSSTWVNNKSSFWYIIDMNYKVDASNNVRLKGTWSSALEPSSAGRGETFTPRYSFYYDYEYGD